MARRRVYDAEVVVPSLRVTSTSPPTACRRRGAWRRWLIVGVVVAAAIGVSACDPDETELSTDDAAVQDSDQDRDRDRDRDQLRDATEDLVDACQDRDRDRLREMLEERVRNRIRAEDLDRMTANVGGGAELGIDQTTIDVEGDRATVTARLRVREQNRTREVEQTWRFRWTAEGWRLDEVPQCLGGGTTTQSTAREQTRNTTSRP